MALPSITYTLTNGTAADADEVQTNFNDLIASLTDGTKSLTIDELTLSGSFTPDTTAGIAADMIPSLDSSYDLGSTAKRWAEGWIDDLTITNDLTVSGNVDGTLTIGDGTETGTDPTFVITSDTGDAAMRLKVGNADSTSWVIRNDNDDLDNLKFTYENTSKGGLFNTDGNLIVDGHVTSNQRDVGSITSTAALGGLALSGDSSNFSVSSGTETDVTNQSVTITTSGRPVMICLVSAGNATYEGYLALIGTSTTSINSTFRVYRGAGAIGYYELAAQQASSGTLEARVPCGSIQMLDTPAAGTYTYKLTAQRNSGVTLTVYGTKLVAYEL